ncbi:hpt domain-containing protein [Dactylonectria macrodidyma]|uniref:Hpt domain-containing protein n=1 Tax=Dactylonectria macrodidyma TaxID=307937 RepID=A0A9P9DUI7_9HYPO|nr:hpt domain-containing protein [Dactylonectria macrodidyma]
MSVLPSSQGNDLALGEDEGCFNLPDFRKNVDMIWFSEILSMDESEKREFSKSIVFAFFEQVWETLDKLDTALADKDFKEIASLSVFLIGSSATLGFVNINNRCKEIQQYCWEENIGGTSWHDEEARIAHITVALEMLKTEHNELEEALKMFFSSISESNAA